MLEARAEFRARPLNNGACVKTVINYEAETPGLTLRHTGILRLMKTLPDFTIVIPTHRRPTLLPRAVEGALAACGATGEVVVVADNDPGAAESLFSFVEEPRLRLVDNPGPHGASAARNCGIAAARGQVILFLDDDDDMVADYPARVMAVAKAGRASWGFSRHFTRNSFDAAPELAPRKKRRQGQIQRSVPFKRNTAGTSNGFWVKRDLCLDVGGFCPDLRLDEDTDLCCRLVAAGHQPWYEELPGTILNRVGTIQRLTNSGADRSYAECYVKVLQRNAGALRDVPGAVSFLASRAQHKMLRAGMGGSLDMVYREVASPWLRLVLRTERVLWERKRAKAGLAKAI
ncbi:glycosyltransferase family 2 protein [Rhodobacter aestuarii]|nr:glycosyltransferase [Rhodobacter aestuarii]